MTFTRTCRLPNSYPNTTLHVNGFFAIHNAMRLTHLAAGFQNEALRACVLAFSKAGTFSLDMFFSLLYNEVLQGRTAE